MIATHVVVDSRDGYTWWRDINGNLFTEETANAWAKMVNDEMIPEARTYVVRALVGPTEEQILKEITSTKVSPGRIRKLLWKLSEK